MSRRGRTRQKATAATAATAAGAVGILALLRGRRERRLKSAMEGIEATVLPPQQSAEPVVDLGGGGPDEAHAPGHHHLAPPPEDSVPGAGPTPSRGYRSGHRDRGGRSISFRTKRGR